ncbi:MAG: rubredoxin [Oscillospiraceae bacterium]
MAKYECACSYVYDEEVGDPSNGVPAGTKWENVPDDWTCPVCGLSKDEFTKIG